VADSLCRTPYQIRRCLGRCRAAATQPKL